MLQYPDISIEKHLTPSKSNIRGSSLQLQKLLRNLISNAAEAQPLGGRIEITTSIKENFESKALFGHIPPNDYFMLSIKDEGMGIDEKNLGRIFEPFFSNKTGSKAGTGLGMSLVWGILEDHQGYIDIDSTLEKGTIITIYLPLTKSKQKNDELASELFDYHGEGEFILVVDDLDIQRDLNQYLLHQLNYQSEAVESGEKAVEYIRSNHVDLVLLDMIMGEGMNGLETFGEIKKIKPHLKVIILSGYTKSELIEEAYRIGIDDYLKKPCSMDNLALSVKKTLMKE